MPTSRPKRRTPRRLGAALAAAGALALMLTGCVGAPTPTPTPTPTEAAPIFASDEEALAAAEAAYSTFEDVSRAVAADGGQNDHRIESLVTSDYLPELKGDFMQYREAGIHIEGAVALDTFSLSENAQVGDAATVSIYVCRDVSGIRVLDASGADVTPPDRKDRSPLVAFLVGTSAEELLVDKVELWPGDDFC
ncbi:hypothetical protein [Agromyces humatus]|uniref:Lipoprotein n=1 Tax=Agromyces humatus TaxID=279573 RepID=A0ABP4WSI1_9MICO|nr:hypothetical protein [Agromyces humatus]